MSRQLHTYCVECGGRSTIGKVTYSGVTSATLICLCRNTDCCHVGVWEYEFDRTTKKPLNVIGATARSFDPDTTTTSRLVLCCTNCGQRAFITKRNPIHREYSILYCYCTNHDCQHRFVSSLSYKNAVVPGVKAGSRIIQDIIKYMPPSERQDVISALQDAMK